MGANHGEAADEFPRICRRNANANCLPHFHKLLFRIHQNTPFQAKILFYFSGEGLFPFREGLSPPEIPLSADSILLVSNQAFWIRLCAPEFQSDSRLCSGYLCTNRKANMAYNCNCRIETVGLLGNMQSRTPYKRGNISEMVNEWDIVIIDY